MYSFLVLGLIPGTNVQISFQAWLVLLACLPFAAVIAFKLLRPYARQLIQWGQAVAPRQPLPASYLHLRVQ